MADAPNVIFMSLDSNFEYYARACLNSLHRNWPNHPEVLLYHTKLTAEFQAFVKSLGRISLRPYVSTTQYKNLGPVGNNIVYNRYRLWTEEFASYGNVLHLDADTLVLKPLDALIQSTEFKIIDNHETLIGVNVFHPHTATAGYLEEDQIKVGPLMANAGVFVLPRQYRTKEHHEYLLYLTTRYQEMLKYADQSVINLWLYKNNLPISSEYQYNFQPVFFGYKDNKLQLSDVALLHFTARKPDTCEFRLWWRLFAHAEPLAQLFYSYLN